MYPILSGAIDKLDSDVIREEELGGSSEVEYPDDYGFVVSDIALDQRASNACSVFAGSDAVNAANAKEANLAGIENALVFSIDNERAFGLWDEMVKAGFADPNAGASNSALAQFFREKGLTEGHTVLSTSEQVKSRIYHGYHLFSGSNRCDWVQTRDTGFFTPLVNGQRSIGHFFSMVRIIPAGVLCVNSWGERQKSPYKGFIPDGFFLIRWADMDKFGRGGYLYNIFAFADKRDSERIAQHIKEKGEREVQTAIEARYLKDERLDDRATAYEYKVVIARVLGHSEPLKTHMDTGAYISRRAAAQRAYEMTYEFNSPYQWTPTEPMRSLTRRELAKIAVRIKRWVDFVRK